MAFVIGICDDSAAQVECLLKFLNSYPENDGFKIIQSTQPAAFLAELEVKRPDHHLYHRA